MLIKIDEGLVDEFWRIHETWPKLSKKDEEIVLSLLWHLSNEDNVRLRLSEGDLVIYAEKVRAWEK